MLSEALRLMRVFHDMKQVELADRLGVSRSHLSEIESGKKEPSLDLVRRYADLFDVPVSSILFFSENLDPDRSPKQLTRVRGVIAGKVLDFLKLVERRAELNKDDAEKDEAA